MATNDQSKLINDQSKLISETTHWINKIYIYRIS